MRRNQPELAIRARLAVRDMALRLPRLYRLYQLGRLERIRRLLRPSYEPEILALARWKDVSSSVTHIIDIGANFGQSAWAFARSFPRASILAFEANPSVAARCSNLLRKKDVHVEPLALGDRRQRLLLHTPVYRGTPFPGLASTDESAARSWFDRSNVRGFRENLLSMETVSCEQERLDALGLQVDLLKIDVEGAELAVIEGASSTIAMHRPTILVECNGTYERVERALRPFGYRGFELRRRRWVPSSGMNLNQLFVHPVRLQRESRVRDR